MSPAWENRWFMGGAQAEKTKGCGVNRVCYIMCVIYLWLFETSNLGYSQTCGPLPLPSVSVGGWQAWTAPSKCVLDYLDHMSWNFYMLHVVEGLASKTGRKGVVCREAWNPFQALGVPMWSLDDEWDLCKREFSGTGEYVCAYFLVTLLDSLSTSQPFQPTHH